MASSNGFQRQEEIGRGSFATVYKAVHTGTSGTQTIVAIKSVNLGKLNKKLKENLTSEISILKNLHHPHIVALIDCKESGAHIHLVMEYVALGDLSHFIKKRDTIKNSELVGNMMDKYPNPRVGGLHEVVVRHFLQQLASALKFLRARNLIHRDVKPQNLLLNPSPVYFENRKPQPMPYCASPDSLNPTCGIRSLPMLKIADFGFARALPPTSLAETLCGSPLYMAPEILRYEKYDAKADLWSVGTVLYEMVTSKPPFRASNHVELLRRIEKGEDKIKFADDILVSDSLKKLIRSLLKRDPRERLSFPDFFGHEIITGAIPGLVGEDLPRPMEPAVTTPAEEQIPSDRRSSTSRIDTTGVTRPGAPKEPESPYTHPARAASLDSAAPGQQTPTRRTSGAARQQNVTKATERPVSPTATRPPLSSHTTAPGRQELQHTNPPPASTAMARQGSGSGRPPSSLRNEITGQEEVRQQQAREQERVAQEVAFEREYVLVEKQAVEMNAFADELAASPRLNKGALQNISPKSGAMVRRATSQGAPNSVTGAQTSASRAVQIASGRPIHNRQNSYERRYGPSPTSATSAISKALNMASGRLFGVGFSPPVNLARGGKSPPGYNPFPAYPGAQSSLVVVGDQSKAGPQDEDSRAVQSVEDTATRSDVVYGFAEVKYRQLTPATPSSHQTGLGLRNAGQEQNENAGEISTDDLTIEALVIVSEEALVLYVKTLALLAKGMSLAARWWAHRSRGETTGDSGGRPVITSVPAGQRMNNVVQWTRGRFNEVLEKTDLVRHKLKESQKRLPEDHPSHPNNISANTVSSAALGTSSAEQIVVSSGITAEKLMYDRAVEMSRSAAINELTGDDLQGCELSYVTAIRMLEAVLESEEVEKEGDNPSITGLEAVKSQAVKSLVTGIRGRLSALRKKLAYVEQSRNPPT